MREILFRGKRCDNGKWVDGFLLKECNYATCSWNLAIEYKTDRFGKFAYDVAEVVTETVGQFTGLTDKNGKKIFEGDIVKCSDVDHCYYTEEKTEFWGVIKFEEGAFGIATKETLMISLDNWCENDNFVSLWELEWNEYIDNVEIVGNIHDNPELLENP